MLHLQRADKRGIRFHHDIILLAKVGDVEARVERVYLDLVYSWKDPGFGIQQLLELGDLISISLVWLAYASCDVEIVQSHTVH